MFAPFLCRFRHTQLTLPPTQLIYVSDKVDPDFPASELAKLNAVLYDQLIQAIIKIMQKLDLSCALMIATHSLTLWQLLIVLCVR